MKTHKEQMEYLKKYDPITYYEMTSDPCGSSSDNGFIELIVWVAIIGAGLLFYYLT